VAAVVFAALLGAGCAGRLPLPRTVHPVEESTESFESLGHTVRVDVYVPEGKGQRHPAAIVLHGSGGVHSMSMEVSERYAEALANRGIAAYVVHYFDATGTFIASLATETREYWNWVRVVHDAVTWVRARPEVRLGRVGLFGFSMGAYVAVGAAATNPRVSRVVLVSGGLEPGVADSIRLFPPALLLHGMDDDVVSIAEEDSLVRELTRHKTLFVSHRYPGEGHEFGESAAVDAVERAARFLAEGRNRTLLEVLRQSNTRRLPDTTRTRIP
jgi:dienelactone hydrolase